MDCVLPDLENAEGNTHTRLDADLAPPYAAPPNLTEKQTRALNHHNRALQAEVDALRRQIVAQKEREARLTKQLADLQTYKALQKATGSSLLEQWKRAAADGSNLPLRLRLERQKAWEEAESEAEPVAGDVHWSFAGWLESVGISELVSKALVGTSPDGKPKRGVERAFCSRLMRMGPHSVGELIAAAAPSIGFKIVEALVRMRERPQPTKAPITASPLGASAATADRDAELSASARASAARSLGGKFSDESSIVHQASTDSKMPDKGFEFFFGDQSDWLAGLTALVGTPPRPSEWGVEMEREHLFEEDSLRTFTASNYGNTTYSAAEYWFVANPVEGLRQLGIGGYPSEAVLMADPELRSRCRRPRPLDDFEDDVRQINRRLSHLKTPRRLEQLDVLAARLYTGPMYVKYNAVCRAAKRGAPHPFVSLRDSLVGRNYYTATIHAIDNAIRTLAPLTRCCKVYRGVSGGHLPQQFLKPDEANLRLGVEFGFMSTTTNHATAREYASHSSGILFELSMGVRDRAASLSFLSQYPFEAELTFAPLLALEMLETRTEGDLVIVGLRPCVGDTVLGNSLAVRGGLGGSSLRDDEATKVAVELGMHVVDRALELHDRVRQDLDDDLERELQSVAYLGK